MRIGKNPASGENNLKIYNYHRVVVPIYIPNLNDDYFKHSFDILQLCLKSLICTIHKNTRISVFSNGCCDEVLDYLKEIKTSQKEVDQLFISDINIGKVNAINSCVRGNVETLITVSDADVLFKPGWQQAVEQVFVNFPKAGMVSPVPLSHLYRHTAASTTIGYGFLKRRLKFLPVKDKEALLLFEKSVGSQLFNEARKSQFLCYSQGDKTAVVSCGHFVATLRREAFQNAPLSPSYNLIGGTSVFDYIDEPNNEAGFLRLATLENFAYHLGNTPEDWMYQELEHSNKEGKKYENMIIQVPKAIPSSRIQIVFYRYIYRVLMNINSVRNLYLKKVGLKNAPY